jgi:hypothetical protein
MKNALKLSLASLAVGTIFAAVLACSGGDSGPGHATKLAYANPTSGDYRLEATAGAGTGTGTVTLALRGPSAVTARGLNFGLALDQSKVKFTVQGGNNYAAPGAVFDLGQAPRIFRAALDGGSLRVSMAQKGNAVSAKALNGDIATVSIQLQSDVQKGTVSLSALEAKVLLANGNTETIQVSVGRLEAE